MMRLVKAQLPSGTVTFLFADIEGSTRLLADVGTERYAAVLNEYRRIVAGNGYVGLDVHHGARVMDAAHGGQVLVTEPAATLLSPDDLHVLGRYRLRDLAAPEVL